MNIPENTPAFQRDQAAKLARATLAPAQWQALEDAQRVLTPAFESQAPGMLADVLDAIRGTLAAPRLLEHQRAALIQPFMAHLLALTPSADALPVRHLRAVGED